MKINFNDLDMPCYVFDFDIIKQNIDKLRIGMDLLPNYHLCYSTKTNSLRNIVSYMLSNDIYGECVSREEYDYLMSLNINCENIVFNGPIKNEDDLLLAINNNSYINLDSLSEVGLLIKNKEKLKFFDKLGLRVNIDLGYEEMINKIGFSNSRFGFSFVDFDKAVKLLKSNDIEINGLHFHINMNYDINRVYKYIVKTIKTLLDKYNLNIKNLNFGGGILRSVENDDFIKYANTIIDAFQEEGLDINKYEFFFEPGAALVANSGLLYSQVVTDKFVGNDKYLITDISRNYFDITNKFKDWKHYSICRNSDDDKKIKNQIICGFTCMEGDRIFSLTDEFELKKGDIIVFNKVGAYSIGLSPLFINGIPKIYYVSNNNIIDFVDKKAIKDFWG